jgi:hypothetical protein
MAEFSPRRNFHHEDTKTGKDRKEEETTIAALFVSFVPSW